MRVQFPNSVFEQTAPKLIVSFKCMSESIFGFLAFVDFGIGWKRIGYHYKGKKMLFPVLEKSKNS